MNRTATLVVLVCASVLLPAAARAESPTGGLKHLLGVARVADTIVIPQEWGGIWASDDSTYDCLGALESVSASTDTLCPGEPVGNTGQVDLTWSCTGTVDANSVNVTCTGSIELVPNCLAIYTYSLAGTRSGDTYFVAGTTSVTYSGSATGCDLIPPSCTQVNSHGTRTGPAPVEYCQTPALPTTWGRLKVRYR